MREIETAFPSYIREMVKEFVVHLPELKHLVSKAVAMEREHFSAMLLLLLKEF